jgi:lipoprotein-anchoring transpeptidase ErfK/SrfK
MTAVKSIFIVVLLATLVSCGRDTETANHQPDLTTPTPTATPTPAVASKDYLPLTFPVLDAFFAEPQFAPGLKRDLSLTDDQVEQLRTTARQETARLREDTDGDYTGSAADAQRQAEERITSVIGAEKASQLTDYVAKRWGGDVPTTDNPANASPSPFASPGASPTASPTEVPLNSPSPVATGNPSARTTPSPLVGANAGRRSLSTTINFAPTDTRIVVNAPAYRMDVFRNGELVKSYRVGIGYPEFPLPTGLRSAKSIVFNPAWTPPDEPWVEAPGSKVKVGQKIEAGDKLNPLGLLKIPIGLPSLIHGGKSPAKLGGFASHGCVGLTDAQVKDFAQLLAELGGTPLSEEQIETYKKHHTETKSVKLATPVPVELRYETIVVEDGKLHIYRDVYDRGTNTEENLAAVLQAWGVSMNDLTPEERAQVEKGLKAMARDARGRSTESAPAEVTPTPSRGAKGKAQTETERKLSLTRGVKGAKEVVIEIAALSGKGYPAPTDLDTGGQKKQAPEAKKNAIPSRKTARRR